MARPKLPARFFSLCLAMHLIGPEPAHAGDKLERLAVLPLSALGVDASSCDALRTQLDTALRDRFAVDTVPLHVVDREVARLCGEPAAWWDCLGQDEILFELGRKLRARWVLSGALAAMGQTQVLRFRLGETATATVSTEVMNLQGGDLGGSLPLLLPLFEHRFPAPRSGEAWYKSWVVWTTAGAVAVAAGIGLAVLLTTTSAEDAWDFQRELP